MINQIAAQGRRVCWCGQISDVTIRPDGDESVLAETVCPRERSISIDNPG